MTAEYYTLLLYLPLALFGLYLLYVMIKPNSESDNFFINYDGLSKSKLLEKIDLLKKIKDKNYSKEKEKIKKIKTDNFSPRASEQIEELLTNTYFNGFNK